MTAVLFTAGLLVWLVAAYAFVRVALSLYRIVRAAPAGQGWRTAVELWSLDFPAVRQRVGTSGARDVPRFARSMMLFAGCAVALVVLTILNIASGSAA